MYEPPAAQVKKRKSCYYWQKLTPSGMIYCCHYLYLTDQRRGPDPCDKYEPKLVVNRRKVYPTVTPARTKKEGANDKSRDDQDH